MDGDGDVEPQTATLLVGLLLAAGVLAVVLWGMVDDDDDTATRADTRSAVRETAGRVDADQGLAPVATDTRAERCSEASLALLPPLEAARPALRQWDVHVGAMNDLVRGEISLQQATRFWNETRLGAQRNIERFDTAWADVERLGVDCPTPGLLGSASADVRSCARLVAAELGVLRAARTSIKTWDTHVHHMDMLRMGTMSPEEATDMWLTMWQRGVRDLTTYRDAARHPALTAVCPSSA
ncbi:hypothetical protein GCM10023339_30650 [Alloalcanivorax gelatiniphagus]